MHRSILTTWAFFCWCGTPAWHIFLYFFKKSFLVKREGGIWVHVCKDENGTEISRTEPHHFLYFIRSNSYFCVRLYRFHFRFHISNIKVENGLDIFRPFSTFLLLIRNIPNSKFGLNRIWLPIITIQPTRQRQVWNTDAHWPHYIGSSPRHASLSHWGRTNHLTWCCMPASSFTRRCCCIACDWADQKRES
jgi:hypothetical protein